LLPQNTQKRLKLKFLPLKNTKDAAFGSPKHAKNPKKKLTSQKRQKCENGHVRSYSMIQVYLSLKSIE
jgi:hypothetical protein